MITRLLSKVLLVAAFALVIPSVARPALAAPVHGRRPHHHRHPHHRAPRHAPHHERGRAAQQPHEL
ncbi:MAG TPA: hypothetical protein VHG72_21530 [Polyangia bacterium]|nr:hypothetical protein [Polyangia bacterium]